MDENQSLIERLPTEILNQLRLEGAHVGGLGPEVIIGLNYFGIAKLRADEHGVVHYAYVGRRAEPDWLIRARALDRFELQDQLSRLLLYVQSVKAREQATARRCEI